MLDDRGLFHQLDDFIMIALDKVLNGVRVEVCDLFLFQQIEGSFENFGLMIKGAKKFFVHWFGLIEYLLEEPPETRLLKTVLILLKAQAKHSKKFFKAFKVDIESIAGYFY